MKKAIIVGATSGIGKGLARLLADKGYMVGIVGRRTELLNTLKNEKPDVYVVRSFDIMDTTISLDHLEDLLTELGGLDLLIVSSGTGDLNDNLEFDIEKRTIETNVLGYTRIVTWAFNLFQKQERGHLVGISSVGGLRGSRQAPSYSATKAYQMNYLEGLRQKATRLKGEVFVTDIRPGFVDTDMAKGDGQFWVSSVDKAARQIFVAIERRRKVAYITRRWVLIGAILKRIPGRIYDKL